MLTFDAPTVAAWVANHAEADPRLTVAAIGWQRDDEITCGVFFENYTGKSITATIAVANGAVMPKEFLRAIFDYPFNAIGCWKMIALVAESNYKSQNLVEKMGFTVEGRISDYYPDGDLIIYSMTKLQCRFLEKEHGEENQDS